MIQQPLSVQQRSGHIASTIAYSQYPGSRRFSSRRTQVIRPIHCASARRHRTARASQTLGVAGAPSQSHSPMTWRIACLRLRSRVGPTTVERYCPSLSLGVYLFLTALLVHYSFLSIMEAKSPPLLCNSHQAAKISESAAFMDRTRGSSGSGYPWRRGGGHAADSGRNRGAAQR